MLSSSVLCFHKEAYLIYTFQLKNILVVFSFMVNSLCCFAWQVASHGLDRSSKVLGQTTIGSLFIV